MVMALLAACCLSAVDMVPVAAICSNEDAVFSADTGGAEVTVTANPDAIVFSETSEP